MKLRRVFILTLFPFFLASCHLLMDVKGRFERNSRDYNEMLRWKELEKACAAFAEASKREACLERAKGAREVSVADYRVKEATCDPEKGTASVRVEFDYYIPPSTRLKTVEDVQRWGYLEENGARKWRLLTPFPEFR